MDWETPQEFVDELPFDFELDAAATHNNKKCFSWLSPRKDALKTGWGSRICWLNPPYGRPQQPCKDNCIKKICEKRGHHIGTYQPGIGDWVDKAALEGDSGSLVVMLTPNRTGSKWFEIIWSRASMICFMNYRLKFTKSSEGTDTAPFDTVLTVFGGFKSDVQKLETAAHLTKHGTVIVPGYNNIFLPIDKGNSKS